MLDETTRPHFRPILTERGMQALMTAIQTETAVRVTHVALGDVGWAPTAEASNLQKECYRTTLSGSRRVSNTQQHLTFAVQGDDEYWIREIGLLLEDGSLFAIWSDVEHPLAWKAAGVDFICGFDLVLTELPSEQLLIEATDELNLAPATEVYRGIVRLATADEASAGALNDVAMTPATTQLHGDERYAQQDGDYADLRARATTQSDVGLSNVPNYSITSAVDDPSHEKFASAAAVKQVNDNIPSVPPRQHLVWGAEQLTGAISGSTVSVPANCVITGRHARSETHYYGGRETLSSTTTYYRFIYRSLTLG